MNLAVIQTNFGLNTFQLKKVKNCIESYANNRPYSLLLRCWNAIKHIFGYSDWQIAKRVLSLAGYRRYYPHVSILQGSRMGEKTMQAVFKRRIRRFSSFVLKYLVTQKGFQNNRPKYFIPVVEWNIWKEKDFKEIFSQKVRLYIDAEDAIQFSKLEIFLYKFFTNQFCKK